MADPCVSGERIAILENQFVSLRTAEERMEAKLDTIIAQLSKLSVLENKHLHFDEAMSRSFKRIEVVEGKQSTHDKFIWMVFGGSIVLSVMWSIFGGWILGQMADTRAAVSEMRMHVVQDKILNSDDIPKEKR